MVLINDPEQEAEEFSLVLTDSVKEEKNGPVSLSELTERLTEVNERIATFPRMLRPGPSPGAGESAEALPQLAPHQVGPWLLAA